MTGVDESYCVLTGVEESYFGLTGVEQSYCVLTGVVESCLVSIIGWCRCGGLNDVFVIDNR